MDRGSLDAGSRNLGPAFLPFLYKLLCRFKLSHVYHPQEVNFIMNDRHNKQIVNISMVKGVFLFGCHRVLLLNMTGKVSSTL